MNKELETSMGLRCKFCGEKGVTIAGLCNSCHTKKNCGWICKSCGQGGVLIDGLCPVCKSLGKDSK